MYLFRRRAQFQLCDVHGPWAQPDSFPMNEVQCGGSYNMSVSVDGCPSKPGDPRVHSLG